MKLDKLEEVASRTEQEGDEANNAPAIRAVTQGAGFGIRFLARIIDIVASQIISWVSLVTITIFVWMISVIGGDTTGEFASRFATRVTGSEWLFGVLAYITYHSAAECISGVSLGKWITGLAVIHDQGGRCSLLQAI